MENSVSPTEAFKLSFKRFKSAKYPLELKTGPTSHDDEKILLDPTDKEKGTSTWDKILKERCLEDVSTKERMETAKGLGLRCPTSWKVYDLEFPEGLILIRNPFTPAGQRYWIKRTVLDFPKPPNITNLDNLEIKEGKEIKTKLNESEFYQKLRWVTFGYHHDWDTKVYSEDNKCEFPQDLGVLTKFMADVLGFQDFKAEAAISNHYHFDSTLSGHVDKSEVFDRAPLFSLSFGQSAVFLIGGRTKDVKPQALQLRSGDVVVMSGESRFSYHAVPKVFQGDCEAWNIETLEEGSKNKRQKLDNYCYIESSDSLNVDWTPFLSNYISKSRVNLNVRQVLYPGHFSLAESRNSNVNHFA